MNIKRCCCGAIREECPRASTATKRERERAAKEYAGFVKFFRDVCDHFWPDCMDMEGDVFQDLGVKHGLLEELPAKTQADRDEWGEDATMFYQTDETAAAIRRGEGE